MRASSPEHAIDAARAVCAGGIPIIELTMTVPGAIDVIRELKRSMDGERADRRRHRTRCKDRRSSASKPEPNFW